jgi:hypothetical protein
MFLISMSVFVGCESGGGASLIGGNQVITAAPAISCLLCLPHLSYHLATGISIMY